jgi:hypothetical protein
MVARPGRLQSAFTAGELDPQLTERTELKYFNTGLASAENVLIIPQGGFRNRPGLRDVGVINPEASRLFSFEASDGAAYDCVFSPEHVAFWDSDEEVDDVTTTINAAMLPELTVAQQLDTMLLFHVDLEPLRIKHMAFNDWQIDVAPLEGVPSYDYGEVYSNGVPAKWRIEFVGLTSSETAFTLTVSGQETASIVYTTDTNGLAAAVQAAILALPNISTGLTANDSASDKIDIEFTGAGNEGDGWAVSGRVINKADAAVLSSKIVTGVMPGEPIISDDRGWPHCGAFYGQRLLLGGLKSLPNTWMMSKVGDYYNFDERFTEANGPAVIPMDVPGGERIERIVDNRNLLIFTTKAEYWLAERALSRTTAPNHVQASRHGTRRGVPIVENEGAALFIHATGGVLGEFRYTDVQGNFVATDISLLATHLIVDVKDQAVRRALRSRDGNWLATVSGSGTARLGTLLREQEITAFTRVTTTQGTPVAVVCNGRNELSWIVQRPDFRRLERMQESLLLDAAVFHDQAVPSTVISGQQRFDGTQVWVLGNGHVFGPITVFGGTITLPVQVSGTVIVGYWSPPKVRLLPLSQKIGPDIVLVRRARIHSVHISVMDTTSIAVSVNGKPLQDIDLVRWGAPADVPELDAPYNGEIHIRGLTGHADKPYVEIGQVRPGRINVKSVTIEAAL